VSHEAIQELTNEIGTEIGRELEGSKIKELEGDKKAQGEYFEEIEVNENPPERIYTD